MNREQEIQLEMAKLKKEHPDWKTMDFAAHFKQSYFWAYSRLNYRYMTRKIKDALKGMCDKKYCVPYEVSEFSGTYFCSRCRNTVRQDHFKKRKRYEP
jgi:hypothetical protein